MKEADKLTSMAHSSALGPDRSIRQKGGSPSGNRWQHHSARRGQSEGERECECKVREPTSPWKSKKDIQRQLEILGQILQLKGAFLCVCTTQSQTSSRHCHRTFDPFTLYYPTPATCKCCVVELYTWSLPNFINQCHANKVNKKLNFYSASLVLSAFVHVLSFPDPERQPYLGPSSHSGVMALTSAVSAAQACCQSNTTAKIENVIFCHWYTVWGRAPHLFCVKPYCWSYDIRQWACYSVT